MRKTSPFTGEKLKSTTEQLRTSRTDGMNLLLNILCFKWLYTQHLSTQLDIICECKNCASSPWPAPWFHSQSLTWTQVQASSLLSPGQRQLANRPTANFASSLISWWNLCLPAVLQCEPHAAFSLFTEQAVRQTADQLVSLQWALWLRLTHTHTHTSAFALKDDTQWEIKGCKVEVVPSLASLLSAWLGFL